MSMLMPGDRVAIQGDTQWAQGGVVVECVYSHTPLAEGHEVKYRVQHPNGMQIWYGPRELQVLKPPGLTLWSLLEAPEAQATPEAVLVPYPRPVASHDLPEVERWTGELDWVDAESEEAENDAPPHRPRVPTLTSTYHGVDAELGQALVDALGALGRSGE